MKKVILTTNVQMHFFLISGGFPSEADMVLRSISTKTPTTSFVLYIFTSPPISTLHATVHHTDVKALWFNLLVLYKIILLKQSLLGVTSKLSTACCMETYTLAIYTLFPVIFPYGYSGCKDWMMRIWLNYICKTCTQF